MDQKKIIEKIQKGLKLCADKHIIAVKDVQLVINSDGTVNLLNANHLVVKGIKVLEVFNVSALENIIFPIVPYLKKKLFELATKKNIGGGANARIFTKQADFYPCVYLQDGEKIVCEITINDLLN